MRLNSTIPGWRAGAQAGLSLAAAKASGNPKSEARNPKAEAPKGAMMPIIQASARDRWMTGILSYYTPQIVETTARSAMAGNLFAQWLMFDLMEQTSPRINKNLNELKRAVISLDRIVQPFCLRGQKPSKEASRRALIVEMALKSMRPNLAANENDFDDTIYDVLDAVGKGISILDVDFEQRSIPGIPGKVWGPRCTRWVHPRYYGYPPGSNYADRLMLNSREVGFNNPEYILSLGQNVPLFIDFPPEQFIIATIKQKTGHPLNASMLRLIGFWWAAQNFTWEWFLKFAQIFGAPFIWANYAQGASQGTIDDVVSMLENLGAFGRAAFPEGTKIDFKEAITQGQNNPQLLLIEAGNTVFDLVILGQTLTSNTGDQGKGGGSFALGKVHSSVRDEKIMSTARAGMKVLNHSMIPSICRLNCGDDNECPTLVLGDKHTVDALEMAQRDQILLQTPGVKMVKQEFYERHDLAVPAEDDEVLEGAAPPEPTDGEETLPGAAKSKTQNPKAETNPKGKSPKGTAKGKGSELAHAEDVQAFAEAMGEDVSHVLSRLQAISEIADDSLFEKKLRAFYEDFPALEADVLKDPSAARAMLPILTKAFLEGLTAKSTKSTKI
jgi:phage gp29-like protein